MIGYVGSGKHLWRSINKYGKENHTTEILEHWFSRKELASREKEIVNEQFLENIMCMNIALGGENPLNSIKDKTYYDIRSSNGKKTGLTSIVLLNTSEKFADMRKSRSTKAAETRKKNNNFQPFLNKTHSNETKNRIALAMKQKQNGEMNSQFGTCWIYDELSSTNKKIKKEELEYYLENGWVKGRKIKRISLLLQK